MQHFLTSSLYILHVFYLFLNKVPMLIHHSMAFGILMVV